MKLTLPLALKSWSSHPWRGVSRVSVSSVTTNDFPLSAFYNPGLLQAKASDAQVYLPQMPGKKTNRHTTKGCLPIFPAQKYHKRRLIPRSKRRFIQEHGRRWERSFLRVSEENVAWFSKTFAEDLSLEGERQPVYRRIGNPSSRLHC